jgi:hypothetical protein
MELKSPLVPCRLVNKDLVIINLNENIFLDEVVDEREEEQTNADEDVGGEQ